MTLASNSDLNGDAADDDRGPEVDDGVSVVENDHGDEKDTVVLGLGSDKPDESRDGHDSSDERVDSDHVEAAMPAATADVDEAARLRADTDADADTDTSKGIADEAVTRPGVSVAETAAVRSTWHGRDLAEVVRRVLVVLVVLPAIGYGLGSLRGESYVSRSEFVFSLDGSVPDGFLREDRRLLTQIVTFTSDAVLGPVAEEFDLEVEDLRAKIDIETVDLSEVLRLEVSDPDPGRAMELNRAVLAQHLRTVTGGNTTEFNRELIERRAEIASELDAAAAAEAEQQTESAILVAREQQLERQISLIGNRIDRLRTLDDEALAGTATVSRSAVADELETTTTELAGIEAELTEVRVEQADLEARIGAGSSARRTIDRLEAELAAVDTELSRRELAPVVGSAFRELSEPTLVRRTRHTAGLQGMAVGMLLAIPVAAYVGYRTRRRQLWLD